MSPHGLISRNSVEFSRQRAWTSPTGGVVSLCNALPWILLTVARSKLGFSADNR